MKMIVKNDDAYQSIIDSKDLTNMQIFVRMFENGDELEVIIHNCKISIDRYGVECCCGFHSQILKMEL